MEMSDQQIPLKCNVSVLEISRPKWRAWTAVDRLRRVTPPQCTALTDGSKLRLRPLRDTQRHE